MPFQADDCYTGMIVYFSISHLVRDSRIRHPNKSVCPKPRPFVCYAQDDRGLTYWTYFTGTYKRKRRRVSRQWLRVPPRSNAFKGLDDLILGDGGHTFVGPAQAFAERSQKFDRWEDAYRPVLLPQGVEEVRQAVIRAHGHLPIAPRLSVSLNVRRQTAPALAA